MVCVTVLRIECDKQRKQFSIYLAQSTVNLAYNKLPSNENEDVSLRA